MLKSGIRLTGNHLYCGGDKPTHVRSYIRVRFGKVENVCEHCRGAWGSRHNLAA